ncbi:hypothetical protein [Epilithonimonas sp.]|uniref:hypothetical protein n=1 Tax=Epilithonimonas sp. TaxID=2894511 RepID=UPI0035B3C8CF
MENQLKATELRCGNILKYLTSEGDYSIMKVNWHTLKWISEDETGFNLVHSPIPLTEDILVKLGFEIRNFNNDPKKPLWWLVIDNRHIDIYINNNGGYYFLINSIQMSIPIVYVHQIQNLVFALTSEELTFKN